MPEPFDLVAIGTGTAASVVAARCRAAGWRVAIVEAREFGGTCALHGCEPKKTLWMLAEAADRARRLAGNGLAGGDQVSIDWPALMAFKRSFTVPVPERRARIYAEAGIEAFQGTARFVGPNAVDVDGVRLEARHILIATGATPATPRFRGAELLSTSDDFLSLERLPRRLVMLGGGYISFECAHIAARAGAAVTILHADDRPLGQFDRDLVQRLVVHSRQVGIAVELGCKAVAVERGADGAPGAGIVVTVEDGRRFEADVALHGLGRVPNLEPLDLQAGDVAAEHGRLRLDQHLRSVASGDLRRWRRGGAGAAAHAGRLARCRCGRAQPAGGLPPRAGLHRRDQRGLHHPAARLGRADGGSGARRGRGVRSAAGRHGRLPVGATAAFKLMLAPGTGCVLGAHLLGPQAEEVINLFALAVRLRLPARDLGRLFSAYPSGGSNISGMLG